MYALPMLSHGALHEREPEARGVHPPEGGWKPHTWYEVVVSLRPGNPPFAALAYTGFLDGSGQPGNYSGIIASNGCPHLEGAIAFQQKGLYLRVRGELVTKVACPHNFEEWREYRIPRYGGSELARSRRCVMCGQLECQTYRESTTGSWV